MGKETTETAIVANRQFMPTIDPRQSLMNVNGAEELLGPDLVIYKIQHRTDAAENLARGMINTPDGQVSEVKFVVLAMSASRCLMPPYDPNKPKQQPLCKSVDTIHPTSGDRKEPGPCALCGKKEWTKENEKNIPPECNIVFNLMLWDLDTDCPFLFSVSSIAKKSLKKFNGQLKRSFTRHGYKGIEAHCCVSCSLSLVEHSNGLCFLPVFKIVERLEEQDAQSYYMMAQQLVGNFEYHVDETAPQSAGAPRASSPPSSVTIGLDKQEAAEILDSRTQQPNANGYTPSLNHPELDDNKKITYGANAMPDITKEGWWKEYVPFKRTAGMTWLDLMQDKPLPDGDKLGRTYLQALAHWKQNAEVAEVAQAAISLISVILPEIAKNDMGPAPFE